MRRAVVLAFALLLASAGPAFAHVTVNPSEVTQGRFTKLTFRVPNESDTERTTALEIVLPEAAPFRSVSVKPVPGWIVTVERDGDDSVTGITWAGGEIGPGEFQEFDISVGPVPDVDVLEFKALQTYSDGEVVRWIDSVVDGEEEPEHPAPRATVIGASGGSHGEATSSSDGDDDGADGTEPAAFAALVLAGAALVAALAALIFARRRPPV
jgi:uncharacterized protein YcnI